MAHYAFLDENYIVIEVIVGKDDKDYDWEKHYEEFRGQMCKRTSYNTYGGIHILGGTPYRKNYGGIGYKYDPQRDAFIPPKPFNSWQLNEITCLWDPPIPMPKDDKLYTWDENTSSWLERSRTE